MRNPKRRSSVDAISNLPANLVDNILARIPLRYAVRTCTLSRDWRYKWTSIPQLVFDYQFDKYFLRKNRKLETIIYQVLSHHQGPINKFALDVPSSMSTPDIDNWIIFLTSHKVQEFTLHLTWGSKHIIPSDFFSFQHLQHLNLYRCVFKPPPHFKGFSRLVTLDFQEVEFVPEIFFGRFISQCLLLERLRLVGCTDLDFLEVEGPSLRFFMFHGVSKSIRFKNCPVLAEVLLSSPIIVNWGIPFSSLPALEKLLLHIGVLKSLGTGDVPNRFPSSLNRLRVLDFSLHLDSIEEVACALALIRSSSNLQKLRITLYASGNEKAVSEFIQAEEIPSCFLNKLKRVDIAIFSAAEPQMEFVRYLLASATGLEEIVILQGFIVGGLSLMKQLEQVPLASPKAVILVTKG